MALPSGYSAFDGIELDGKGNIYVSEILLNQIWVLSPDGSQLAVTVTKDGETQIWLKRFAGGAPQKFTFEGTMNQEPSYTHDGQSLSFIRGGGGAGRTSDLFVQSLSGGARPVSILRTPGSISEQVWSPVSEKIAVRTTTSEAGAGDILRLDLSDPQKKFSPLAATSRSHEVPT